MRPLEITLSGFKGIRDGLGRKTVTLDLRPNQGLCAIVGDNGRGKSTILGNMHPFRLMPDRVKKKKYTPSAFSFYDETYGRDARKELIFEMEGREYRSVILIDAEKRKQEAYLYRRDGDTWTDIEVTKDGKLDAYDEEVERLVGSPRMFFTSNFRCQKAVPLSSYTRGEMMGVFAELIDIEDNKEKQNTAADVAEALLQNRAIEVQEKSRLELLVLGAGQKEAERVQAEARLNLLHQELATGEETLKKDEAAVKALEISLSVQAESAKRFERLKEEVTGKTKKVSELTVAVKEKRNSAEEDFKVKTEKKNKTEARITEIATELASTDARLKSSEESLKRLEIKDSMRMELVKRRQKLTEDLTAKEKQLKDHVQATLTKRESYLKRHKEKKVQLDVAETLAKKAVELTEKVKKETETETQVVNLKDQIKKIDEQLTDLGLRLRDIGATESLIKENEKALQGLRLAKQHAIEVAQGNLKRAEESIATLEGTPCASTDMGKNCKFVREAIAAKEILPSLQEALKTAESPDPKEKEIEGQIKQLEQTVAAKSDILRQEDDLKKQKEAFGKTLEQSEKALTDLKTELKLLPKVEEAVNSIPGLRAELEGIVTEAKTILEEADKLAVSLTSEITALKAGSAEIKVEETLPVDIVNLQKSIQADRESLENLRKEEGTLRVELGALSNLEGLLKDAETASVEMEKQVVSLNTEIASLEAEMKNIAVDENLPERIKQLTESADTQRKQLETLRSEDASLRVSMGSVSEALKGIEAARVSLTEIGKKLEALDADISDWQLLEKAMEGITTLEIDDAGPAVTANANDILHTCYGTRFSVKIKTQDEKIHSDDMKEIFDIEVLDSWTGTTKSLSVMSGGEETWIDDAITRAISLFNASKQGKRYDAIFADEKDGRLTEKNRKGFMAVKRRVMQLGGFVCEYFISHTKAVQDLADVIINLDEYAVDRPEVDSNVGENDFKLTPETPETAVLV